MQDTQLEFQNYLNSCRFVLSSTGSERDHMEILIQTYLKKSEHFLGIKRVFEEINEPQVKLITIESLSKVFLKRNPVGANEYESRYRGIEEYENGDYCQYRKMLDFFADYLAVRKLSDPIFVVNSICDFYGNTLKFMIANSIQLPSITDLELKFFNPNSSIEDITIGLKLLFYSISNLLINAHHYGYFKFRKMVYNFQNKYLIEILNIVRRMIKFLWLIMKSSPQNLTNLFKDSLEIMYKCLTYPFNLTYFDFNTDGNNSEITITIFPEDFASTLGDMEFYDCLFGVFFTDNIELKISCLRILSRIASTRLSIFEEKSRDDFRSKFIYGFTILVQNCNLEDQTVSSEIVEYVLKIIFVFGQSNIREHIGFPQFMESAEIFSNCALKICYQLENQLFLRIVDFWNKLENMSPSFGDVERKGNVISNCISKYCEYHFNQSADLNFFQDSVKSSKKFIKHINNRFDVFKDYVKKNPDQSTLMMLNIATTISQMEERMQHNQLKPDLFYTKFSHFVLIFSKAFLKTDLSYTHFQSYMDDFDLGNSEMEPLLTMRLAEIASFIFNVMKNSQNWLKNVSPNNLIGYEMSVLYFLENFITSAMDKHKFNESTNLIIIEDTLYLRVMEKIQIFGGFEEFFDLMTNKILGNLDYRILSLSEYSIAVLKTLVEKIKKIFKGKSKVNVIIETFTTKLQNINFSVLNEKTFYKLRSKLLETIAVSYLDDNYDDYINNSHSIFERIITTNTSGGKVDLMKVFYDLIGIYRAISLSKIIIVFSKISYPRIQDLLQKNVGENLSDPEFVSALLDFYNILIENTSQKYSVSQAHTVMYKILTDACQIVTMFLKDINKTLELLATKAEIVKFLETNLKLVKKLFQIFRSLIKYSDISFSIFHFFGYTVFLDFIRGIHLFMSLTVEHIINHFPDKSELFLDCFKESCINLSDFMIEYFSPEEIHRFFKTLYIFFVKKADDLMESSETNTLQDESMIQTINGIVTSVCISMYEGFCINRNDVVYIGKMNQIFDVNKPLIANFCYRIVELCSKMNYSSHANNLISDVMFYFLVLFNNQQILGLIVERIQSELKIEIGSEKHIRLISIFEEMGKDLVFKLELSQREKFHERFKDLIKALHSLTPENSN